MEGAATGGTPGEAVLLWGANTVCRRRGGGTPRRGAANIEEITIKSVQRVCISACSL